MPPLKDKITVGSRVTIAAEAELRGDISIGSGTVIHPRATILAVQGPIVIGQNCIVEELAVILNRGPGVMKIGDENLFEVGCRIEAPRIGDHNTFEPRSKVSQSVLLGSFSTVGAACTLTSGISSSKSKLPSKIHGNPEGEEARGEHLEQDEIEDILSFSQSETSVKHQTGISSKAREPSSSTALSKTGSQIVVEEEEEETKTGIASKTKAFEPEQLPDNLVIYGIDSRSRIWSGEGVKQSAALHAKHLSYLQDNIPKFHKLKIIDNL